MGIPIESRVSELIDQVSGGWKFELIKLVFITYEGNVVFGIALSARLPEDKHI